MQKIQTLLANNIIKNIISLGGATLLSAALSFILGVVTRNILGPTEYGYWLTISLLFTFIPLVQFGVVNAMNREVPFYKTRKDFQKVKEIKDTVFSFIITIPFLFLSVLFVISLILYFTDIDFQYQIGFLYSSLISFLLLLSTYVEMYFKSEQEFRSASRVIAIKSILQSLFTVFLTYILGYQGLYIGMGLALLIQLYIGRISFKNIKFVFDIQKYKTLIKIGFPILFVGIVWSFLIATDRLIISIFMTPQDLGNYGVGMLIFNSMMLIPQVIGQVFYPKIVEYVSRGQYRKIHEQYWKVNKILAICMLLVVGSIYFLFPYFVKTFMPNYTDAIKTGQILIWGIYPLTLIGFAANYFNATKNQKVYMNIQFFVILSNIIISIVLLNFYFKIESVALATSVSFFLYFLLMNFFFLKKIRNIPNNY